MATPHSREELKQYCLRRLGQPVVSVNVDETQLQDRIDDALQYIRNYHQDGTERTYLKHKITQADLNRRYLDIDNSILNIVRVLPWEGSASSGLFDVQYQLHLNDFYSLYGLGSGTGGGDILTNYVMSQQQLAMVDHLLNGHRQLRFNRHTNRLHIDVDWTSEFNVGMYLIFDVFRVIDRVYPVTRNAVPATELSIELQDASDVAVGDVWRTDSINPTTKLNIEIPVTSVDANTITLASASPVNVAAGSRLLILKTAANDIWNDIFLKKYTTALIKEQWGMNLTKFTGATLPGGIELNGEEILSSAREELERLDEEMRLNYEEPVDFYVG